MAGASATVRAYATHATMIATAASTRKQKMTKTETPDTHTGVEARSAVRRDGVALGWAATAVATSTATASERQY